MVKTTRKQREALFKIFLRDFPSARNPWVIRKGMRNSTQYRRFRNSVQPEFCGFGAVMVPWRGMWLGVEKDGYTHS